jgi:hypothetical protein
MKRHRDEIFSRYIVEIIKLIDVEFIMIKIKRMIQLNLEWLTRDELQTRKQINRITQTAQTHTYFLVSVKVKAEKLIYDRQNKRIHLLTLTLNSNNIEISDIKRKVDDNDKNENNDDERIQALND